MAPRSAFHGCGDSFPTAQISAGSSVIGDPAPRSRASNTLSVCQREDSARRKDDRAKAAVHACQPGEQEMASCRRCCGIPALQLRLLCERRRTPRTPHVVSGIRIPCSVRMQRITLAMEDSRVPEDGRPCRGLKEPAKGYESGGCAVSSDRRRTPHAGVI